MHPLQLQPKATFYPWSITKITKAISNWEAMGGMQEGGRYEEDSGKLITCVLEFLVVSKKKKKKLCGQIVALRI